ncbi:MAG: type II toxin-antitoxin system prevent-host-death family antitoxin [Spirochaetales bacterium]|nr:type II toxin-antitoxin system prevent-host-death family antitoxin [Spirochaetales bacterium]
MGNKIDVFSSRDLRIKSGSLIKDAENGHLSIITKHGKPVMLTIPFDTQLIKTGLTKNLALYLFENGILTLAKAAKIASISIEEFLEILNEAGIDCVDYPAEELDNEIKIEI